MSNQEPESLGASTTAFSFGCPDGNSLAHHFGTHIADLDLPPCQPPPGRLRSIRDRDLRRRACEAWRLAHQLVEMLHIWSHFVLFAGHSLSLSNDCEGMVSSRCSAFSKIKAAIDTVKDIRSGNTSSDGNQVRQLIIDVKEQFCTLASALHYLGVEMPTFQHTIDETRDIYERVTRVIPYSGTPSLFPGNREMRASTGIGLCDIDFEAMFQRTPTEILPLQLELKDFLHRLKESPLVALTSGIELQPSWESTTKTLHIGATTISLKRAGHQTHLLDVFQDSDWANQIEVGLEARQVSDAVKNLNKRMKGGPLSFHVSKNCVSWRSNH